ncbi:hypothetical protein MMC14_007886, partial [Varicellaria rhodocarpa]|nr:hypothetical protein [Varicellaria rhodocarpa]
VLGDQTILNTEDPAPVLKDHEYWVTLTTDYCHPLREPRKSLALTALFRFFLEWTTKPSATNAKTSAPPTPPPIPAPISLARLLCTCGVIEATGTEDGEEVIVLEDVVLSLTTNVCKEVKVQVEVDKAEDVTVELADVVYGGKMLKKWQDMGLSLSSGSRKR